MSTARKAIQFTIVWLCLVGCSGWLIATFATSVSPHTLWMWTGIAGGWIWLCSVGGMFIRWQLARDRPALLSVQMSDNRVLESTNAVLVGGRIESVVLRMGRKTDTENRSGLPIVQIAVVFELDRVRCVEAVWTFDRHFFGWKSRSIEERLRAIASANGIGVVVVEGDPQLVAHESV